ncbi:MAG TPA: ABC transporter ATP-binding protein, partial [Thermaerobacter sp.]
MSATTPAAGTGAEPAIVTRNLQRTFGRVRALAGIDMVVPRGAVYGFIGPNGAGKTTCLRILAGLLEPSGGEARVCGLDVARQRDGLPGVIGYMPDFFGVYDDLTVTEYLDFYAACYGLRGPAARRRRDALLELVDLADKAGEMVNHLSRGMKQRLGLARALIHDPQVLLLDEPASGLDPAARIEFRELIRELAAMGKTLVVSSHILSELADFCTHVGILHRGRLLVSGTMAEVLAAVRRRSARVHLVVPPQDEPGAVAARARQALATLPAVTHVEIGAAAAEAERGDAGGPPGTGEAGAASGPRAAGVEPGVGDAGWGRAAGEADAGGGPKAAGAGFGPGVLELIVDFAGGPVTLAHINARLVQAGLLVSHV